MRNENVTHAKKKFNKSLPITLFIAGIFIPVFTTEVLFIALSFAPFYGYMLVHERHFDFSSIFVSRFVLAMSIVLGITLSVLGYNGILPFFEISGYILLINVIPSFVFMIYTIYSVESKDPSKWSSYSSDN
jgi:hypothetical protein